VESDAGTFWFKANIAPLAFEIPLLGLAGARSESVPRLVAADATRAWLLIEDAGAKLSDVYDGEAPSAVWRDLLRTYARIQLEAAPDAEALIAAGVPDRRLETLVPSLRRVLATERLVRPPTEVALTDDELEQVHGLLPTLAQAVDVVAAIRLPDSVQHDDLHPWNVCVQNDAYCVIDWSDACVSQPLLSFTVPLAHIPAADVADARAAYLQPWTMLCPQADLVEASAAADLLGHVSGILKWELISSGLTDDERSGFEDAIPRRVRSLLEAACV
jgi:phosphotransferase family enzyme